MQSVLSRNWTRIAVSISFDDNHYTTVTIEEMKEAMTKDIHTLTQVDFHGAFHELLKRYNKCIAAGRDIFEGDESFMCVLSIKVPITWLLICFSHTFVDRMHEEDYGTECLKYCHYDMIYTNKRFDFLTIYSYSVF